MLKINDVLDAYCSFMLHHANALSQHMYSAKFERVHCNWTCNTFSNYEIKFVFEN